MPTTPNIDTARRLKDISTLSQMITATTNDPDHADVTTHLQDAVVKLGNVIGSDGGEQVRLVKSLVLLLQRLGTLPHPEAWLKEIHLIYEVILYISRPAIQYKLQMPTFTDLKGKPVMANFALPLDKIATFTITEKNTVTGALDPVDPADVFTAVSSDLTNLEASIGTDANSHPALVVKWLHTTDPLLVGVTVTLSDSLGNLTDVEPFDMVQPAHIPDQTGIDVAGVVLTDQPVPI